MTKKTFKRSALGEKLKKGAGVQLRSVVTDPRVLELRGPVPGVVVTIPLELYPQWLEFHHVEVTGENRELCLVKVKRITEQV